MLNCTSVFFFAVAAIIWGRVLLDHLGGGIQRFPCVADIVFAFGLDASLPWQWAAGLSHWIGQLDAGIAALAISLAIPVIEIAVRPRA